MTDSDRPVVLQVFSYGIDVLTLKEIIQHFGILLAERNQLKSVPDMGLL